MSHFYIKLFWFKEYLNQCLASKSTIFRHVGWVFDMQGVNSEIIHMNIEVVAVKNKQGQTIDDMYQKGYYIFKFTAILTTPILRQEFGENFHKGEKISMQQYTANFEFQCGYAC